MDIPELVDEHLGGEELRTGVMLGDDDIVCITATRTLLYRADGLLSDESVTEYPHEVERLQLKEGRRKTKFVFEYVEGTESFSVPNDVGRDVLGLVMEGVLLAEGLFDADESVVGAFRFSELTLVIGERRVVKHVGGSVWEEDFEMFAFEDLTGLEFEKASVATEVVLRIAARPQRIKTPNDQARIVEQTLKKAVFEYFDVTSMDELQAHFQAEAEAREAEAEAEETEPEPSRTDDIGLEGGGGIDPLVEQSSSDSPFADPLSKPSEEPSEAQQANSGERERPRQQADDRRESRPSGDPPAKQGSGSTDNSPERREPNPSGWSDEQDRASSGQSQPQSVQAADAVTSEDMEKVMTQLNKLTKAVNQQNKLLREQQQAFNQLVEELRQGR